MIGGRHRLLIIKFRLLIIMFRLLTIMFRLPIIIFSIMPMTPLASVFLTFYTIYMYSTNQYLILRFMYMYIKL
mgnify:CR=1 FL=1